MMTYYEALDKHELESLQGCWAGWIDREEQIGLECHSVKCD